MEIFRKGDIISYMELDKPIVTFLLTKPPRIDTELDKIELRGIFLDHYVKSYRGVYDSMEIGRTTLKYWKKVA